MGEPPEEVGGRFSWVGSFAAKEFGRAQLGGTSGGWELGGGRRAPERSLPRSSQPWQLGGGRRAPERELPTAYPSPTFPTEQTSGGGLGERSLGEPPEEVGRRFRGAQLGGTSGGWELGDGKSLPERSLPRSSLGEQRWREGRLSSHPPSSQPSSQLGKLCSPRELLGSDLSGRLFPSPNSQPPQQSSLLPTPYSLLPTHLPSSGGLLGWEGGGWVGSREFSFGSSPPPSQLPASGGTLLRRYAPPEVPPSCAPLNLLRRYAPPSYALPNSLAAKLPTQLNLNLNLLRRYAPAEGTSPKLRSPKLLGSKAAYPTKPKAKPPPEVPSRQASLSQTPFPTKPKPLSNRLVTCFNL